MSANFSNWLRRRQSRNALMKLDDRQLADIGISRSEIDFLLDGTRQHR
ncbi:DUF1127 domain-containing protein [Kaistia dalseonensis]|uniref:Uncharacterized protein YjiS (DUF1127 family) n=1 Tax=Kaistia dalseonensis TaxID=410840 RepID=A0ABU0HBK6_9HYPH|nr:DUF1127 domain-containing protein [Kaistia dalseonensis]MCX5497061.1 DUF1127 domain-containing protein [Kaistia dalseonensis]MDQ0439687.1 uncharacterized protein YjiS (DUF1127 family) [Kaistia dalseonensis]